MWDEEEEEEQEIKADRRIYRKEGACSQVWIEAEGKVA